MLFLSNPKIILSKKTNKQYFRLLPYWRGLFFFFKLLVNLIFRQFTWKCTILSQHHLDIVHSCMLLLLRETERLLKLWLLLPCNNAFRAFQNIFQFSTAVFQFQASFCFLREKARKWVTQKNRSSKILNPKFPSAVVIPKPQSVQQTLCGHSGQSVYLEQPWSTTTIQWVGWQHQASGQQKEKRPHLLWWISTSEPSRTHTPIVHRWA